jgi:serine/threonine protein kinase
VGRAELIRELRGKYRIVTELGSGGSADIWLALAQGPNGFNKLVVLKTLRTELLSDTHLVRLFLEEARLAARLNHPNIVQTNEVFVRAGRPVIVMEYLDGVPTSELLERQRQMGSLTPAMLLRIVSEALGGLHAAHELKDFDGSSLCVVHRDVSPHNLLVTFAGQVKVLDFGIAKFSASGDVTETGIIKGKLRYMPPEQINAEPVDRRGDIYSMGVVLWEIATGRRMWPELNEGSIMKRILSGEIPSAREVNSNVAPELERIICRSLNLNREARYPTALDMQLDLDEFISELGEPVRNRQIGRTLSMMFEDLRDERARTIDQRVARAVDSVPPFEETPISATADAKARDAGESESTTLPMMAMFIVLLSLFGGVLIWQRSAENEKEILTKEAGAAAEQKGTPNNVQKHREVQLRITAFPGDARLFLDGKLLASNPHAAKYARTSEAHDLLIQAKGHNDERRALMFDQDQEIVLSLKKQTSAELPVASPRRVPPESKPSPSNQKVPSPEDPLLKECSPPHFFDQRGIKKYKPECL